MTVQLIFPKHYDSVTTHEANRAHLQDAYLKFGRGFLSHPIDETTTVEMIRRVAAQHFGVAPDHIALRVKPNENPMSERVVAPLLPFLKDDQKVSEELSKAGATEISVDIQKCPNREHCPKTIAIYLNFSLGHESQLIYVTVKPGMTIEDLRKIIKERTGLSPDIIPLHTLNIDSLPDGHQVTVDSSCTIL